MRAKAAEKALARARAQAAAIQAAAMLDSFGRLAKHDR